MKILEMRTTDGPNYWHLKRHQLVVMLLDLEELEELPTNLIDGFYERITAMLPTMYEHRCSEGVAGGFFLRVKDGTWMGHVIEHIALELQALAGMNAGFGRTRGNGVYGQYHVVVNYEVEEAGRYATRAAVAIAQALVDGTEYNLGNDIAVLRKIAEQKRLGPSTASIVAEAERRNIPWFRLNDDSLLQFGYGSAQKKIDATIASTTSNIGVELSCNKEATKRILAMNHLPVPEGETITSVEDLPAVVETIGYPIVIKPLNGNHGNGATINITNPQDATSAFHYAKKFCDQVVVERYITGYDFRVLVINYKMRAVALRTPANVIGDGISTISQLIENANRDPRRGEGHCNVLTKITIDDCSFDVLKTQGLALDAVPAFGRQVFLKATANLSTGGTAEDVTDEVHPENKAMFERAARLMGLDICGIDVMSHSLSEPMHSNGAAILEINAAPGLRMHLRPAKGTPRNVAAHIVDMLFPMGADGRIPILAVTGTNGKTTTTRLLAHIAKSSGSNVGYTTTDGVYINDQRVLKGDCTGPLSARLVLHDPNVNVAVLECARGGMLRSGLGFDQCDIAIVTNVAEDHLGLSGINNLEQLARIKAIVPGSVKPTGYAILNADDDIVYNMKHSLECNVALFSTLTDNPRIMEHVANGGTAAIIRDGNVTILQRRGEVRIGAVEKIPLTFRGTALFNIANVLAATLGAWLHGIHPRNILAALKTFIPGPETTPGRMNMFDFGSFKVIVDYAHNTHGLKSVSEFLNAQPASWRVGVIAGIGDRREQDIKELACEAARVFDEIIIRHDKDLRGRKAEEIESILLEGITSVQPGMKVTIIPDEIKSAEHVVQSAIPGSVSVIFTDDVEAMIQFMKSANRKAVLLENRVA